MNKSLPLRLGRWMLAMGLLALAAGVVATWFMRESERDTVSEEQKIARTLEIIRTSTPTDRKVLKVLFYGQSITRSGWDKAVIEHWHQQYPNTVFVVQNRALGGFASPMLLRTTEQDLAAFYPDLIIFHVYGDHHAYEKIIRLLRSKTAADVIVQTDHGESLPDPPCVEGLRLTLRKQAGCTGLLWVKQKNWYDEMSYHKIPGFAKKYGLAVEPQRGWWRDYLLREHVEAASMLRDEIHPNEKGKELIATFFNQYFDSLVLQWNGQTGHNVISIPASSTEHSDKGQTVDFEGSRLELISNKALASWPAVAIDGTSPKEIDSCYLVTRSSPTQDVPDWPALRRITLQHDRTPEDWKAVLTKISPDEKSFHFAVSSSIGGDEGEGDASHDFVSKSGKLRIDAQDWMIERAFEEKHIPLKEPFEVTWSVKYICGGEPEVIDRGEGKIQYRYLLAAGLSNGRHALTLQPPIDFGADGAEFRVYKPSLQE